MKQKISKPLLLPLFYGILAAWIIAGGLGVALLAQYSHLTVMTMVMVSSAIVLMAVIPSLMRAAWVYSNLRRYHTAEYFYNLGNGVEKAKAIARFERRVNKAVNAWISRYMLRPVFNCVVVSYLLLVVQSGEWLTSLWILPAMLVVVIAVEIGLWTMLFSARKLCYDNYGNLKNN